MRYYHSFLVEIIVENVNMKNIKTQGKKLYITRKKEFYRRSRPEVFFKKDVLRSFTKFTGKNSRQSLLFIKVVGRPSTLLKRRFWHRSFPLNFVKFLKLLFFIEHLWWLLLDSNLLYLTKNALNRTSNAIFKMKVIDLDESWLNR